MVVSTSHGGDGVGATADVAAGRDPDEPWAGLAWLGVERLEDMRRSQDELRADVRRQGAELRAAIDHQGTELRAAMYQQGAELRTAIDHQGTELRADLKALDGKIDRMRTDQRWFIGVLCVTIIGMLAKLFLPAA